MAHTEGDTYATYNKANYGMLTAQDAAKFSVASGSLIHVWEYDFIIQTANVSKVARCRTSSRISRQQFSHMHPCSQCLARSLHIHTLPHGQNYYQAAIKQLPFPGTPPAHSRSTADVRISLTTHTQGKSLPT